MILYRIEKTLTISAAHRLSHLDYDSKCKSIHGHNWKITVVVESPGLDHNGMVVDFGVIKKSIMRLDHADLNVVLTGWRTTAEGIASALAAELEAIFLECENHPQVISITVEETEGNKACYIP